MDELIDSTTDTWQSFMDQLPNLALAFVVLLVFFFLGKYFGRLVILLFKKTPLRNVHESFFSTLILLIALFFGTIVASNILGLEGLAISLLAGGGVTAVVLGFAFREVGENFLAGIFLAFSSPFKSGDVIRSEDMEGKVVRIDLRSTHIRTDDGCDVFIPSSQLFNRPVMNFTRDGLRRFSFTAGIDYANDAAAACELLTATLTETPGVLQNPAPLVHIQDLDVSQVTLKGTFWVDVFRLKTSSRTVRTQVLDRCRQALLENGYTVSAETTSNLAVALKDERQPDSGSNP